MRGGDGRAPPAAVRVRAQLRRGSEEAGARIARGLGEPALFAIALSAVGSSIYFALGVVAGDALGLTPLVFVLAGVFFVVTMLTYVEGNSLHPERGGASTFARYAFDELWSFIAGWAIILDYLIVLAFLAFAVPHYLEAFWGETGDSGVESAFAAATLVTVVAFNVRGISAERVRGVLRVSLLNLLLFVAILAFGFATLFHPSLILDSIHLGSTPAWDDLVFAAAVATVATTGIEAASGLAGEVRVGKGGLRRVVIVGAAGVFVLFGGMSVLALMAVPVEGGTTALGDRYAEAPVLGIVSAFDPGWVMDTFRYAVGAVGAVVLIQAANGQMLGVARLSYSLARNRQIPSVAGRLHERRGTPYVAIGIAALLAFALTLPADVDFLAGLFAFGAMLSFTLAHLSVIVLRFTEADRPRAFRVPFSIRVRGGSIPVPAAVGALLSAVGWVSVIVLHQGARLAGGIWMVVGITLYVVYRRSQDKPLRKRFTVPEAALKEEPEIEYGSILVPVFGEELDDDIVGTAGRLAAEHAEEGEGGAVLEALYVFEIPMSLPIDARVPEERVEEAKRVLARAKEVGEEYEGVEVATAMVRGRTAGAAIVSEAKRRGVEAIVLAAEQPTRIRGGALLGGRGRARDRFVGETTRYVVEKAPCSVILTAPPASEDGSRVREGVAP
ncbi:MAG TPA: amino acid permease [Thermoleophilaceae bacterium]|nr:amino acid permease [Thermoleophilaceae bacterium]